MEEELKLDVIDGETLMDNWYIPNPFCVETLLPNGLCILGGAPKVGKSWLVLDLCVRIAKGEPIWNLKTTRGTTLYLCLEDTLQRLQARLTRITDEVPANAFFATAAGTMQDILCEQIREFVCEHPNTKLVAIDTFQIVRGNDREASYGNDYQEIRKLKRLAEELNICLLLVHHLRKQGDSDPLNKLSGTTGITGGVDTVFVLDKEQRGTEKTKLICTGRDIPYRELELRQNPETFAWELVADSLEQPEVLLPEILQSLLDMMKQIKHFHGTNTDLANALSQYIGNPVSPKGLKQRMNRYRFALSEQHLTFNSCKSNGEKSVLVTYDADEATSAPSASMIAARKIESLATLGSRNASDEK